MTEREIYESYRPNERHYEKAKYALDNRLGLLDFDEWCFISDVLKRDVSFYEIHLMNEYVEKYNEKFGTNYDWDWLSFDEDASTRELFENMIAFAKEADHK